MIKYFRNYLDLETREKYKLALIMLLSFLVMLPSFVPHFTSDGYTHIRGVFGTNTFLFTSVEARPFSNFLIFFSNAIGFNFTRYQVVYNFFAYLILLISSLCLYQMLVSFIKEFNHNKLNLPVLFGSMLVFFNLFSLELFMFNLAFFFSIQYLLILWIINRLLIEINLKNLLYLSLVVFISLSLYQAYTPIFLPIFIILYFLKYRNKQFNAYFLDIFKVYLFYGVGNILNLGYLKLVAASGTKFNGSVSLFENIKRLSMNLGIVLVRAYGLLPKYSLLFFIAIFTLIVIVLVIKYGVLRIDQIVLIFTIGIFGSVVLTIAPHVLTNHSSLMPRFIGTVSAIPGILILLVGILKQQNKNNLITFNVLLGIFSLFIISATIQFPNYLRLLNKMDKHMINRIEQKVSIYEQSSGIAVNKVVFYYDQNRTYLLQMFVNAERNLGFELALLQSPNYFAPLIEPTDVFAPAFTTSWSRSSSIEYYTGRVLLDITDEYTNNGEDNPYKDEDFIEFSDDLFWIEGDILFIIVY